MALWKDSNNQIHDDMDGEALALPSWPQGMTQLTPAEANALISAQAEEAQAALAKLPDPGGFGKAVKSAAGGILGANALAAAYPLLFPAVQEQAWEEVQAMLADAGARGTLTGAQCEAVRAAAARCNIPVTL